MHSPNLSLLIVCFLVVASFSIHIEINNIHHGYKTTVEGVSRVQESQGNTLIVLTNLVFIDQIQNWQMDQVQPELIPFFKKDSAGQVSFNLSNQMIQGVFEQENQVILLVFEQNTSIITTITLKPHPDKLDQDLSQVGSVIKEKCQWSEQAL